jgi:hypothetical protein
MPTSSAGAASTIAVANVVSFEGTTDRNARHGEHFQDLGPGAVLVQNTTEQVGPQEEPREKVRGAVAGNRLKGLLDFFQRK